MQSHLSKMGPVSLLLFMVCLGNLVSSQSTEMDSGQCEQSNAVMYDIAEDSKAMGADIRRLREELAGMKKQQQRLYTVIEEIRQMLMDGHSTTVTVSLPQCSGEFVHRNSNLGSCYFISKTKLSWNDAVEDCIRRSSYLAEIQSEEETGYLARLTTATTYWIGGNDIVTESAWVWEKSGEHFTYTNWVPSQPSSGRGGNCLLMLFNGQWTDTGCSLAFNYICEMKGQ